jgi:autotransporter-associated beta strand protein
VDPNVKLTCNAPIVGSAFRRPGGAGTGVLLLGGNSSFSGDAKFDAGLTILTHSNALGAGATAANLINLIGTLDLNGNNITSRYVNFVNGSGLDSMGELRNTDLGRTSTVAVNCNVGAVGSGITHVGGPGDIAISGSLTNAATFVKTGTGTLTLKGSNALTGATVCRNGGLVLDYGTDNNSKLSDTADLRLSQAAVRFAGSSGAATTETIAHLGIGTDANMPAGGSSVTVEPAPNRNLTLAAQAIAFGGNNAVDFDLRTNGTGVGSVTTTNSNGVLAGARATVGRSTWAKVSGGTVTGMADGEYATTFDGGNNATHVDAPAGIQTINTTTGQTIRFAAAAGSTVTIPAGKTLWLSASNNPPASLTAGILMTPNAGPVTIDGDGLLNPGVNKTVYVNQYSTNPLTISARIDGQTGAFLMKLGPGELRLTHTNNVLAGADLILVGGTLTAMNIATGGAPCSIGSGKTPPTISLIQMGNATLKYIGTGDRHNRRIEMRGPAAVDASGSGTLSFMGLTNVALNAYVAGNDYPLTLTGSGSGVMEGVLDIRQGSVIKDGAGAWTIGGTQPYVGNTVVTNGTLFLTNNCVLQRSLYVRPAGTLAGSATIGEDLVLNGARRVVLRSDSDRDMLNVGYDVALGGTLVVSNAPGYTPAAGVSVPIATTANGTISGAFAGVTGGYTVSIASGQVLLAYTPPPPAGTIIMVR